jgi:SAM-dependent methyltransferase
MPLEQMFASIASRYRKVGAGLVVGFGDGAVLDRLRELRGGVWMSAVGGELPYDDNQFDVVALDAACVARDCVREANRVLKPDGCLFFTVLERVGGEGDGMTAPEMYRAVREGFDIIELRRPPWWKFGRNGRIVTVCARKKAWREHRGLIFGGPVPVTPLRSRT